MNPYDQQAQVWHELDQLNRQMYQEIERRYTQPRIVVSADWWKRFREEIDGPQPAPSQPKPKNPYHRKFIL